MPIYPSDLEPPVHLQMQGSLSEVYGGLRLLPLSGSTADHWVC